MATPKAERLLNLVICLMSARAFVTAEFLRSNVIGYMDADQTSDSFKRMLERDKNELRELGIPVETGRNRLAGDEGYRISPEHYYLPDISLERDEAAAVAAAATLWHEPDVAVESQTAVLKLRAAGIDVTPPDELGFAQGGSSRTMGDERVLRALLAAIDSGSAVEFDHRRSNGVQRRTLEPWGVVTNRGRWYVTGHDRTRDATRTFRISRISEVAQIGDAGAVHVPAGADVAAIVSAAVDGSTESGPPAHVWVAAGRAFGLRRMASNASPEPFDGESGDILTVDVHSHSGVVRAVLAAGPEAVVLDPPSLREAVVSSLDALLAPPAEPVPSPVEPVETSAEPVEPVPSPVEPVETTTAKPRSVAPSRISRLLAMVPYFLARPGIKVSTAAQDLGLTEKQLTRDLEQLFMCGLPGYMPDELIDIQFYEGYVHVGFTAGMDRPLRLTGTEANMLLVALRMLLDSQGALDSDSVRRAIAKIEEAVGAPNRAVAASSDAPSAESPVNIAIRTAVREGRTLRLNYYTPSRDEVSERIVDPIRVQLVDNHSYLEAWCRRSEGVRLFRFDRVDDAHVLDEPARPPAEAAAAPPSPPRQNAELPTAIIEIDPSELWLLEYFDAQALEAVAEQAGPVLATLTYGSPEWLARTLAGFGGRVRLVSDDANARRAGEIVVAAAQAARSRY